jgi:hypothetical protein
MNFVQILKHHIINKYIWKKLVDKNIKASTNKENQNLWLKWAKNISFIKQIN